ncbi:Protein FAM53B [Vulpes lagopus]
MVMILSKSLDNQGADSVACRTFSSELHTPKKMSQGPTLFSCGIMENDRWRDLDRKCPLQIEQPSTGLWECLPEKCQDSALWHREAATRLRSDQPDQRPQPQRPQREPLRAPQQAPVPVTVLLR